MLTDDDVKKITSLLATKEDLATLVSQNEFAEFREKNFDMLDGIAKAIEDLKMEYVAIKTQLDRHDRWIKELAQKSGVDLTG